MNVSNDYSSIMVFGDRLEAAAASRLTEGPDADHWRSREFAERAAAKRATAPALARSPRSWPKPMRGWRKIASPSGERCSRAGQDNQP